MMKLQRCVTFVISADFAGTPKIGYCVLLIIVIIGYSPSAPTLLAVGVGATICFDIEFGKWLTFITIFTIGY